MAVSSASVTQATKLPQIAPEKKKSLKTRIWDARWCYIFMAPALVLAAMFTFYPIIMSWYYSLFQWSGFTADKYFLGIDNYLGSRSG